MGQKSTPKPKPEYNYVEYLNVLKSNKIFSYNNVGNNAQDITDRIISVWNTNDICDASGNMLVNMWIHFEADIVSTVSIHQSHNFKFVVGENVRNTLIAWFYHEEIKSITCQYWSGIFDQDDRYKVKWCLNAEGNNDPPSYYYDLEIIGNPAPTVIMLVQSIASKTYYKLSTFSNDSNIGMTDNMLYSDYPEF